jgi:hypothetical protein
VIGDLSAELGKHARRGARARGTRPTA